MKKINIQKKNFKKYISLTLMLSGINAFGMDYPKELENLNEKQNKTVSPEKEFILQELVTGLKKIVTLFAEMMKIPSYINTNNVLKKKLKYYLEYEENRQNKNQFIIDNIKEILNEKLGDRIAAGENFQIKINQNLNFDDIFSMMIVINEIFSEILPDIIKNFPKSRELKSEFTKNTPSSLRKELLLLKDIFENLKKCWMNIINNSDKVLKNDEADYMLLTYNNSVKNEEKIKLFEYIINEEEKKIKIELEYIINEEEKKTKNQELEEIKKIELQKEIDNQNEELKKLKKTNKALEELNQNLKNKFHEQRTKTEGIIKQFEAKAKAKEIELKEEIDNKNEQLADLEQKNKALKELNEYLKSQYNEQINKKKEITQKFEQEINNKNKQLTNLEQKNKALDERYKEQIAKTEEITQKFEQEINNKNKQLTNLEQKNKALDERYKEQIAKTEEIIQEFEAKAKAKEIEFKKEIKNKNEQLADLEQKNKTLDERYKEQIAKTKEIIQEFEAKAKEIELQKEQQKQEIYNDISLKLKVKENLKENQIPNYYENKLKEKNRKIAGYQKKIEKVYKLAQEMSSLENTEQ